MRPLVFWLALVLALNAGCVRNVATGKRQLMLISQQDEIQLGQSAKQEVIQGLGLVENPALQQYVSQVGTRLAQQTERPDLPWSFQVVDDASVNAFALPGGPIFVTRGILAHMGSEAELASVLGHEIAHVTARHSAQQLSKAQLAQAGLGLGSILLGEERAGLAQLAGVGLGVLLLRNSRDAEREADKLGLGYVVKSRYEPDEMVALFQTLSRVAGQSEAGRLPGWLQTHPEPEERLRTAQKQLAELPPMDGTVEREPYLRKLEGVVYGANPRQGFFQGQTFLHPDLRFRFLFPEGYKVENQPQAVVGVSPRQDAAVVLSLAPTADPQAAMNAFASQPGIQVTGVSQGLMGTLNAVSGGFFAQAEQQRLEGVVTFVRHGERTFQLVGFTPAGNLAGVLPAFQRTMASFEPLNDPAVLNVQPARIELTPVPEPMTLAQFLQRFPSTVSAEELARINGVDPAARLEAGRLMKRVVGGVPPSAAAGGR
jgi:predicted Zn-dependent protease